MHTGIHAPARTHAPYGTINLLNFKQTHSQTDAHEHTWIRTHYGLLHATLWECVEGSGINP